MHSHVTCQMTKSGFISLCCYKETVEHLEHMCFLIFCTRGILHLISVTSFIARFYSICLFEGSLLCQYSYPGLQFKQEISRSLPLLATLYLKCPMSPGWPIPWVFCLTGQGKGLWWASRSTCMHSCFIISQITHSKVKLSPTEPFSFCERDRNKRYDLTR